MTALTDADSAVPGHDRARLERAKVAVAVTFAVNGLALAGWVARLPALRDALELTPGRIGLLLLFLSGGTLVALPLSGLVVQRFGPIRSVTGGALLVTVGSLGLAGSVAAGMVGLAAASLAVYGLGISTWDVAMNVEGADVERRLGRVVMPRFHAGFSLGTVLGAGLGALTAAFGVGLDVQLALTAPALLVAVLVALRGYLPVTVPEQTRTRERGAIRAAWSDPRTLLVGTMVMAFALIEGSANDWVALAVVDGHEGSETFGAVAFGIFVSAMTLMRLVGGHVIGRLGPVLTLRVLAALVAAGVLLVITAPSTPFVVLGALLWGLGAALGFPMGMTAVSEDPDTAAVRVSVVSSIGYTAFLAGPPLIGLLADSVGILRALLVIVGAAGVAAVAAAAVRPVSPEAPAGSSPVAPEASPVGGVGGEGGGREA